MTAGKAGRTLVEVLVLGPERGLCFLDGKVHEVRLNLDDPFAQQVQELLEAREGSCFIKLALGDSGKGRVVAVR